jgi:hypothetical protein
LYEGYYLERFLLVIKNGFRPLDLSLNVTDKKKEAIKRNWANKERVYMPE